MYYSIMQSLLISYFIQILNCGAINTNESLVFPTDVIEAHILLHLNTRDLFKMAMCINKQWSAAAIREITARTSFLSLRQMKVMQARAKLMNLTLYQQRFEYKWLERNAMINRYSEYPSRHPLQFRAYNQSIIIKTIDNDWQKSVMEMIIIKAHTKDYATDFLSIYSIKKEEICIGKNPIIKIFTDKVSIYKLLGDGYDKQYEFKFFVEEFERIQYYDIQIYTTHKEFDPYDMAFIDYGHPFLQQTYQPISIIDIYSLDMNFVNASSTCIPKPILRQCNLQ